MRRFLKLALDNHAAEVAELAVVLPILFTMIFAIFSFGRAYNIYSTVTRAAQEGARVAVTPACASCTPYSCPGGTSEYPCDASVAKAVTDALAASNLDSGQIKPWAPSMDACPAPAPSEPCSRFNNITVCRGVILNSSPTTTPQACGTVVQFKYSYQPLPIPFFPTTTIGIPARAQMWMEY